MRAVNPKLYYRDGYKYQTDRKYRIQTQIKPKQTVSTKFLALYPDGVLEVDEDYGWDGPSGPAIDTKNFMVGSLVHDAGYELMRKGLLDPDVWRRPFDCELVRLVEEDGMFSVRAKWVYLGVRIGGGPAARNPRKILEAP